MGDLDFSRAKRSLDSKIREMISLRNLFSQDPLPILRFELWDNYLPKNLQLLQGIQIHQIQLHPLLMEWLILILIHNSLPSSISNLNYHLSIYLHLLMVGNLNLKEFTQLQLKIIIIESFMSQSWRGGWLLSTKVAMIKTPTRKARRTQNVQFVSWLVSLMIQNSINVKAQRWNQGGSVSLSKCTASRLAD